MSSKLASTSPAYRKSIEHPSHAVRECNSLNKDPLVHFSSTHLLYHHWPVRWYVLFMFLFLYATTSNYATPISTPFLYIPNHTTILFQPHFFQFQTTPLFYFNPISFYSTLISTMFHYPISLCSISQNHSSALR